MFEQNTVIKLKALVRPVIQTLSGPEKIFKVV